jgi:hypothetical protein
MLERLFGAHLFRLPTLVSNTECFIRSPYVRRLLAIHRITRRYLLHLLSALSSEDDKYSTPVNLFVLIVVTNGVGYWVSLGQSRYMIRLLRACRSTG